MNSKSKMDQDMQAIIQETRRTVEKIHGPKPSRVLDEEEFGLGELGSLGVADRDEFGLDDDDLAEEMGIPRERRVAREPVVAEGRKRASVRMPGDSRTPRRVGGEFSERAARLRDKRSRPTFEWRSPYFVITDPGTGESVRLRAPEQISALLEAIERLGI